MVSVHDAAKYIVRSEGPLSPWRLHKLLYYAQAWHLTWEEKLLFRARIEAWSNGPVVAALYPYHRGSFEHLTSWHQGRIGRLATNERESVDVVLKHYRRKTDLALRELTHREEPWRSARAGLLPGETSHVVITSEAMASYYGSLETSST